MEYSKEDLLEVLYHLKDEAERAHTRYIDRKVDERAAFQRGRIRANCALIEAFESNSFHQWRLMMREARAKEE